MLNITHNKRKCKLKKKYHDKRDIPSDKFSSVTMALPSTSWVGVGKLWKLGASISEFVKWQ